MSCYLFVLCPPYCGSTLLWKLLATSESVSTLPQEGQFLPELEGRMREKPWNAQHALPWTDISKVWHSYWDTDKAVLLEKSPPNIIRTHDLATHFQPAKFIIMVRNPYAQCEGLMRRNNWNLNRAANFAMMCLRTQLENRHTLSDTQVLTYESLVTDPAAACEQLATFMPELKDLDYTENFEVHSIDGTLNRPITDLNTKKIAQLGRDTLASINAIFLQHRETLDAWGYTLLTPETADRG